MATRILIVDDSAAFREGLHALLETRADFEVCGEAEDGLEAVEKNRLLKPHVIIMDQSMPRICGIKAAQEILEECPRVSIILLTLYLTKQLTEEAHNIGVQLTFSKTATGNLLDQMDALLCNKERTHTSRR